MMRVLLLLFALVLPASAQESPVLEMEFDETAAIPGQPLSLRLTVLVPTFLPDPPAWPAMEIPSVRVRVASSGPTSRRIDGATWAGVSRRYLLTPMIAGNFALPAQEVAVSWADPETNAARETLLATEPIAFSGVVPAGAEGLDPFIAADTLTIEQSIEGETEGLAPGDSVIRNVTVMVGGASPMFLPVLLPAHDIPGFRAYAKEPVVEEREERGVLSGTRKESVTLIAEGGGTGEAPAIMLDWFNLATGEVETARADPVPLSVEGPPVSLAPVEAPRDWRRIAGAALAGAVGLALLGVVLRWLTPVVRHRVAEHRARWLVSEQRAWRMLTRTVRRRDDAALRPALDEWASRLPGADPRRDPRVGAALAALGAARYGPAGAGAQDGWRGLAGILPSLRHDALRHRRKVLLPPLNPAPGRS
ncbi:hypothetical protein OEZ60_15700 [Defluviimonas sp. WL0024]|uniref:Oxygen tolerance n=1 Tax=Albidovulum salinarum TaxID=2984153 RepID=A0ABT2XCM3_9RHOB|nr:hypothetical protein [Defluviimonas sp. WL0024]MCU9849445.1 hypothetical protein [Defluviimonas sp. WL0024]